MDAFPKHISPTQLTRGIVFTSENAEAAQRLIQLRSSGQGDSVQARLLEFQLMKRRPRSKKGFTTQKGATQHFGKLNFPKKR